MIFRTQNDGIHIVLEGIDGSGKSTAISACREWAEAQKIKFFDVIQFCKDNNRPPSIKEIGDATGLLTGEPTFCWTGCGIRQEMVAKSSAGRYSGKEIAEAFALDRLIQLRRLIIPFLQNHPERIIIQDRNLLSSLAYQPLQEDAVNVKTILDLSGNQQALAFAPTDILILRIPTEIAQKRLAGRKEKQDDAIFEEKTFQEKLEKRYETGEVLNPFEKQGTTLHRINASATPQEIKTEINEKLSKKYKNLV